MSMQFKDPVIGKMPEWLIRTFKIFGAILMLPVVLVTISILMGWIGDLTVTSKWQAGRQKALDRTQKAKTAEYVSGYAFAVNNTNAWEYYLKSAGSIDNPKQTMEIDHLIFNETFNVKEAHKLLFKYQKQITIWDSGACSRYCYTQIEYEKCYSAPIPDYLALQKMLKLSLLKGRMEFALGQKIQGAITYSKAVKTAMDFSGGSELLIGRMVGLASGKMINRVIANDLNQCDIKSSLILDDAIERAELLWPSTQSSLLTEAMSVFYFLDDKKAASFCQHMFIFCWRHYFSIKRTLLFVSELEQKTIYEVENCKNKYWANLRPILEKNKNNSDRATKGDFLASLYSLPNIPGYFASEYKFRMDLRVLKDALILKEYRLKNGKYPASLDQAVKDSPEYNDIADGKPLHYNLKNNVARLYSIGLNLKDDGGQGFSLSENLVGSRDKEVKDDLWIELK